MRIRKALRRDWHPKTAQRTFHGKPIRHMAVGCIGFDEAARQAKPRFFYDARSRPAK